MEPTDFVAVALIALTVVSLFVAWADWQAKRKVARARRRQQPMPDPSKVVQLRLADRRSGDWRRADYGDAA